jgi:integrase/recombinase XerD
MLATLFPSTHARYASLPLLSRVWDGLCAWLHSRGYPANAIRRRVQGGPWLESVLKSRGVCSFSELTGAELRAVIAPRPSRWTEQIAMSLVCSLVDYLGELGMLAATPLSPTADLVARYIDYMQNVRGLAAGTATREGRRISQFLRFLDIEGHPDRLRALEIRQVELFIVKQSQHLGRASMVKLAATLRSFFRYLAAKNKMPCGLDSEIDSPRCFREERIPRALPWSSIKSLLCSVDRSTVKGLRDYAMLLLIAVYGLRVSEVAAMKLEDVLWRHRQIRLMRPKVGSPLLLPLTDEVATALHDYLRHGRTACAFRHLFVRIRVPFGPIKGSAVSEAFDAWARKAAVQLPKGAGGPHCLRHSLAVYLLRQGAPVKTIGDLLGHGSAESTCVYLRLQIEDLRDVALPLPSILSGEAPI